MFALKQQLPSHPRWLLNNLITLILKVSHSAYKPTHLLKINTVICCWVLGIQNDRAFIRKLCFQSWLCCNELRILGRQMIGVAVIDIKSEIFIQHQHRHIFLLIFLEHSSESFSIAIEWTHRSYCNQCYTLSYLKHYMRLTHFPLQHKSSSTSSTRDGELRIVYLFIGLGIGSDNAALYWVIDLMHRIWRSLIDGS